MKLSLAIAIAAMLYADGAQAQAGVLPQDLARVADSLGCGPVPEFYARPGVIDAPFVFGLDEGERSASAAFWCLRPADREYRLVVVRQSRPVTSYAWWNPPSGLTTSEVQNARLSEYRRLDRPETLGPDRLVARRRVLKSEYDGVYTLFLEWEGVWYYRVFH